MPSGMNSKEIRGKSEKFAKSNERDLANFVFTISKKDYAEILNLFQCPLTRFSLFLLYYTYKQLIKYLPMLTTSIPTPQVSHW